MLSCLPALTLAAVLAPEPPKRLDVRPIAPPQTATYGLLGFEIRAPWMTGHLQMRMPETLNSSLGLHFIDHDRADMRPLSPLRTWPTWKQNRMNGAWSYSVRLPEGVEFSGKVIPYADRVRMEFRVRNRTRQTIRNVANQMCLVMSHSPDFGERNTLARMWTFRDGVPFDLERTTPTPRDKGRDPWVLMLTRSGARTYAGPRDYPDGWWVVDQAADLPVIARTSVDGKHVLAITWDGDPVYLMSNTRIPCLHAGPTNVFSVEPGKECIWRGTIWLMPNDAERLRRAVEKSLTP
ncbi:MAG: hypothetical protein GX446_13970 [Chthonomonadales bacterium]|nr:hypothetical protein [Chthonomonadales bacterium]